MRIFASMALAALLGQAATPASAQSWPQRTVRLIVPFPAGGPTDLIARVIANAMAEQIGQSVIIDNRGGAGGVTGTDVVAKSTPDGHTLALTSAGALAIAPSLQRMPYQPTRDLKPITLVAKVPELLIIPATVPAKNLPEFIAYAKSQPGKLNYGSTGAGSMSHLAAELFRTAAGLEIVHVAYSGAAPAINDLLPGRTQMMFSDMQIPLPHVQAGTLRALGVGSAHRVAQIPDVPTLAEQGLKDFEAENWYGLVAAAATPAPVIAKIHDVVIKAMRSPEVQKALSGAGAVLIGNTPEEFTAYIEGETAKWAAVVKASGAKLAD
jgi:tripartite-type tricarboxylate transporter receptor subunit TctC